MSYKANCVEGTFAQDENAVYVLVWNRMLYCQQYNV